jgi:23S rRNA pseudouridine2605 synthase
VRLQKILAQAGYGARRKCEELIAAKRVTVNGKLAALGDQAEADDDIRVDGKPIARQEEKIYIALNKPPGISSDTSDARNKTVFDLVNAPQRLFAVGRLDKDSRGLVLLTNDGEMAYQMTHPKFEHEKEYRALVEGVPNEDALRRWREGVMLEGETRKTAPCEVSVTRTIAHRQSWLRIVLREGRKRQIRRVAKLLGYPVVDLVRVRIGRITLGQLESGEWRALTRKEIDSLHD